MNATRLTAGIAGVAAAVAVVAAIYQSREARSSAAELVMSRQKNGALAGRIAEVENKIQLAERRAADGEKDSGDLLKVVAAVRAQQALPVTNQALGPSPGAVTVPGLNVPMGEGNKRSIEFRQTVVDGRVQTVAYYAGTNEELSDEDKQQLAQERAYENDRARRMAKEAMARAELDEAVFRLDPTEKLNRRIEAAGQYAAKAEFQTAVRILNQAMAEKPADLPVPESVGQLQAELRAQSSPVDVTLTSDGQTFVSVAGQKFLGKIVTTTAKILPGDYEVWGRRTGFRDVVVQLQVRNGVPPPIVSIACTQPAEPRP